jgi:hypothetical protein
MALITTAVTASQTSTDSLDASDRAAPFDVLVPRDRKNGADPARELERNHGG